MSTSKRPLKLELSPTIPDEPGRGILRIRHWQGASSNIRALLMHVGAGQQYLQVKDSHATWQTEPAWLEIPQLGQENDEYVLELSHILIDPLLFAPGGSLRITLAEDIQDTLTHSTGLLKVLPGVLTSDAGSTPKDIQPAAHGSILGTVPAGYEIAGSQKGAAVPDPEPENQDTTPPNTESHVDLAEPEPPAPVETGAIPETQPEPVTASEPEPVATTEPEPAAKTEPATNTAQKKSGKGLTIALATVFILILLGGGGAAYWLLSGGKAPDQGPCTVASITKESTVRAGVKACLDAQPDTAKLLGLIKNAKSKDLCDVIQLVYSSRGRSGDKEMALAYAREYDPKFHKGGKCFDVPDSATAAYWYKTVLEQDPDNQEAKDRLKALES